MIKKLITLLWVCSFTFAVSAADDARLLRFPDINNNLVVFVYAGDIWSVNATGGEARKLTSHEGLELFPKISPDGRWIAFSAEYSGSRQVWVIPAEGGTPKQLTFYNSVGVMPPRGGYDNVVLDWTPDSKKVLFRGNRTEFGERQGKYYLVSIDGGFEEALQIVNGGFAAFSPDATQLAFTPVDREFRTWKRYKGGRATELWTYNLKNNTSEQITRWVGTDQWPVWFGNDIFYASDQDTRLNIWKYNTQTKQTQQITNHREFDVMWPSGSNGKIVYENGGYLYVLNTNTGKTDKINVSIRYDNPNLVPYFKNVREDIHSANISPTAKRVLIDARGDIFSVPAENGTIVNLTNTQGVREIYPSWSPDGKYIAYYSDATGEYEIYLLENKEGAKPRQLTSGSSSWKYQADWSPDSKHLLYSDRTMKLWLVDVQSGKQTAVDQAGATEIRSYDFSPDGNWIAYTKEQPNSQSALWLYDISAGKKHQVTDATFADNNPVFSRDGKFLFFTSNRDFNLAFSSFEFDYLYNNATRIYALALRNDGSRLSNFKTDVEKVREGDAPAKTDAKTPDTKKDTKTVIDLEGLSDRIEALPLRAGGYRIFGSVDGGILYGGGGKISRYNIADEKSEDIMDGGGMATISADGKSFLYSAGRDMGIARVAPGQKPGTGKLDLATLSMKIDPKKEWDQIYTDAWRIFRDFFYVDNMHNVDWKGISKSYGAMLPHVGSRFDLDYLLNEIVSETNTGHAYVDWGDIKRPETVRGGLLGADLKADEKTGRYRITKIYPGENWNEARRSPLTEGGVNVKEGDYLISINGRDITTAMNPYEALENLGDKVIELGTSGTANPAKATISKVKTITSEFEIKYLDWVQQRRAMVDKLSNGRIGYIHVPNTAVEGNRELYRGMYAYNDKEALIIDDRYNGGGFIPDRMIDLLDRRTLAYWHRNGLDPMKSPGVAHNGPKVMLINGYSSSGGDAFPYFFRKTNQGKLIGTRTWGGLVGISGNARLVDGGYISVPRFGIYDESGNWIIEGVGVYPDIEVVDRPEKLAKGEDPGIEKAVEVLLDELKRNPVKKIVVPKPPDRSKWIEIEIP